MRWVLETWLGENLDGFFQSEPKGTKSYDVSNQGVIWKVVSFIWKKSLSPLSVLVRPYSLFPIFLFLALSTLRYPEDPLGPRRRVVTWLQFWGCWKLGKKLAWKRRWECFKANQKGKIRNILITLHPYTSASFYTCFFSYSRIIFRAESIQVGRIICFHAKETTNSRTKVSTQGCNQVFIRKIARKSHRLSLACWYTALQKGLYTFSYNTEYAVPDLSKHDDQFPIPRKRRL